MHDHFARSTLTAGSVQLGSVTQLFDFTKDQFSQLFSGAFVVFRNVYHDPVQIVICLLFPFKPVHASTLPP